MYIDKCNKCVLGRIKGYVSLLYLFHVNLDICSKRKIMWGQQEWYWCSRVNVLILCPSISTVIHPIKTIYLFTFEKSQNNIFNYSWLKLTFTFNLSLDLKSIRDSQNSVDGKYFWWKEHFFWNFKDQTDQNLASF